MKPIIPSTFPKTFVIKNLEKHRSSLAVSLCFTTFALMDAGEHAFIRPNSPDRQNATFHLLTPIPRIFRCSTLPPAARIATYETDRIR